MMKFSVKIELANLTFKHLITRHFQYKVILSLNLALDLLKKMLEKDPFKRISATEALKHEFFGPKIVTVETMGSPISQGSGMRERPPAIVVERQNNHAM